MFIKIILVAFFLLLIGDFLATFFYHIPEHVFGEYDKHHTRVHHIDILPPLTSLRL